jgi:hypothetical protein
MSHAITIMCHNKTDCLSTGETPIPKLHKARSLRNTQSLSYSKNSPPYTKPEPGVQVQYSQEPRLEPILD